MGLATEKRLYFSPDPVSPLFICLNDSASLSLLFLHHIFAHCSDSCCRPGTQQVGFWMSFSSYAALNGPASGPRLGCREFSVCLQPAWLRGRWVSPSSIFCHSLVPICLGVNSYSTSSTTLKSFSLSWNLPCHYVQLYHMPRISLDKVLDSIWIVTTNSTAVKIQNKTSDLKLLLISIQPVFMKLKSSAQCLLPLE